MANEFLLVSALEAKLVADVRHAVAAPRTPLQIYPQNDGANQRWRFIREPNAGPGWFFIESGLDHELVIDVEHAEAKPGAPLQIYGKKPEVDGITNQLWRIVNGPEEGDQEDPGEAPGAFFIESSLGEALVIDVRHAEIKAGIPLQIYGKNPGGTSNQIWKLAAVEQFVARPVLETPATFFPPAGAFTLAGKGFFPGDRLSLSWVFDEEDGGTANTVKLRADFSGAFVSANELPILQAGVPGGPLHIEVSDLVSGAVLREEAKWTGTAWSLV